MGRVVYVVEDEEEVARSLIMLLCLDGYDPVRFGTAEDFLAELPELEPGHVVMNIRLPGRDGIGALQEMRSRGIAWPATILTGHPREAFETEADALGAVSCLEKPCDPEAVLKSIRESERSA